MKISNAGIELIKRFEGCKLKAYQCPAGVWTIGYGTTRINGNSVQPGMTITTAQAEDAANAVEVDIEALPVVTGRAGLEPGAPLLFAACENNCAARLQAVRGDTEAAFNSADYVRRETFRVHRHSAIPMETRGLLAEWDAARGHLTLSGAAKVPFSVRAALAKMLGLPEQSVDAVETDMTNHRPEARGMQLVDRQDRVRWNDSGQNLHHADYHQKK